MTGEQQYVGKELDLFVLARNWKAYWVSQLQRYVGTEVLEVGAGFGANTKILCEKSSRWVCLEPDPALSERLRARVRAGEILGSCEVRTGTLRDVPAAERFDTILYCDVLEHIEDDAAEIALAASHLRDGGRVIVLSPALPFLYSRFDRAIGHHRRYTRKTLAAAIPCGLVQERLVYLDSVGMLASLANRLLLRQTMPDERQIGIWDEWLVPWSRWLDPAFGHRVGKSVLGVWRMPISHGTESKARS